jgi:hypothetical protein
MEEDVMRRSWVWAPVAAMAVAACLFGARTAKGSQESTTVWVQNFPEVQQVKGSLTIPGPIAHAILVRRERVVVPPMGRLDVNESVMAGVLEADGFTQATLSLQGEVADRQAVSGTIGALLIPDEEPVVRDLREARRVDFPLEVAAQVTAGGTVYFSGQAAHLPVGFPRYRIYFYNTSNKGVELNLYVYLTN